MKRYGINLAGGLALGLLALGSLYGQTQPASGPANRLGGQNAADAGAPPANGRIDRSQSPQVNSRGREALQGILPPPPFDGAAERGAHEHRQPEPRRRGNPDGVGPLMAPEPLFAVRQR